MPYYRRNIMTSVVPTGKAYDIKEEIVQRCPKKLSWKAVRRIWPVILKIESIAYDFSGNFAGLFRTTELGGYACDLKIKL